MVDMLKEIISPKSESPDAIDVTDIATTELTVTTDDVTNHYPLILKSLDVIDVSGNGNEIHVIDGYSTVSSSSTIVNDNSSTITLGYLEIS